MKNLRSVLAALAVLLMAAAAQAQTTHVIANVPFTFVVGDRAYPAGEYSFKANGVVLRIADPEQIAVNNVLSNTCTSAKPADGTKLIFRHMGDYYFLSQIWVAGSLEGREIPRSHTEVRLAQNHQSAEPVIVAANVSQ